MKVLCVLVFVIHTLSLSSSSFIEEEHNLWYFSCTTIFVMFLLLSVMKDRKSTSQNSSHLRLSRMPSSA